MQFPPPPLFLNLRLVPTHRDKSRLKTILQKRLRRTTTKANHVNKRHRASRRARWLLPKALLMARTPTTISLPSLLCGLGFLPSLVRQLQSPQLAVPSAHVSPPRCHPRQVWRWARPTSTCATQPTSAGSATPPRSRVPPRPNASSEGRVCAHHDSRSQSYSTRATPFPGFGNRTNTSGSCPGMINRGLLASCFIRSCAARLDLASSVAVIGACLSRFSYR